MRLFIATPSPFSRKVRIFLRETKITCEELTTNPWSNNTDIAKYNPLAKIPILLTDDGKTVFDSSLIIEYLHKLHPEQSLIPKNFHAYLAVKRLEKVADGICDAAVLIILEKHRSITLQSGAWISRQEDKIFNGLTFLSEELNEQDFFATGGVTIADISVGCALSYLDLRLPDLVWRENYPKLGAFSSSIEKRPSFQETLLSTQEIPPVD